MNGLDFTELYKPSTDSRFDDDHKCDISRQLQNINGNLEVSEQPVLSAEEIQAAVRLGKRGKAAGEDGITYEHIQFGGEILNVLLAKLFSSMLILSYALTEMKMGLS